MEDILNKFVDQTVEESSKISLFAAKHYFTIMYFKPSKAPVHNSNNKQYSHLPVNLTEFPSNIGKSAKKVCGTILPTKGWTRSGRDVPS